MSVRYRMRRWYDHWLVLLFVTGSVFPRALVSIAFSTFLAFVYWECGVRGSQVERFGNPQVYAFFMQTAALVLAFTTSISYNRFWEALGHLTNMTNSLSQAASFMLSFDECTDTLPAHKTDYASALRWRAITLHFFSIFHAVCCQTLFSADGVDARLDILGGLTEDEQGDLSAVEDQAALVFHWIGERLAVRTMTGGLAIPPPICSQLWSCLSSAMSSYQSAVKIVDTPLPLPYQQCLAWSDIIVMFLTPLCVCLFVNSLVMAALFTFCTSWMFHGIYLADVTMQQPFGNKSNDLPVVERHQNFIDRLVSFVTLDLANEINRLYEHVDATCKLTLPQQHVCLTQTKAVSFRAIEVIPRRHSEDCGKYSSVKGTALLFGGMPTAIFGSNANKCVDDVHRKAKHSRKNMLHYSSAVRGHHNADPNALPSPHKQFFTYRSTINSGGCDVSSVSPALSRHASRTHSHHHHPNHHAHGHHHQRMNSGGLSGQSGSNTGGNQSSSTPQIGALFLGDKILAKEYILPPGRSTHDRPPSPAHRHTSSNQKGQPLEAGDHHTYHKPNCRPRIGASSLQQPLLKPVETAGATLVHDDASSKTSQGRLRVVQSDENFLP